MYETEQGHSPSSRTTIPVAFSRTSTNIHKWHTGQRHSADIRGLSNTFHWRHECPLHFRWRNLTGEITGTVWCEIRYQLSHMAGSCHHYALFLLAGKNSTECRSAFLEYLAPFRLCIFSSWVDVCSDTENVTCFLFHPFGETQRWNWKWFMAADECVNACGAPEPPIRPFERHWYNPHTHSARAAVRIPTFCIRQATAETHTWVLLDKLT